MQRNNRRMPSGVAVKALNRHVRVLAERKGIQALVLFIIGIAFYLCIGQEWIAIEKDSAFYLDPTLKNNGVMPVYPLFLFGIRIIFGENLYLGATVVVQSLLAIFCTMLFVLYLQSIFRLRFMELILCYILAMLPFTIELPRVGITHGILTEGVAYALFYIYFIFVLKYVFSKKIKWILAVAMMSVLMGLIRSQMIFLLMVTAVIYVSVELAKRKGRKLGRRIAGTAMDLCISAVGVCVLIFLIYQVRDCYLTYAVPVMVRMEQRNGKPDDESEATEVKETQTAASGQTKKSGSISQMTNLIIIKGFYEADEADVELFDTPHMQEIFRRAYAVTDELGYRYVYARQDLYMWRDLVKDKMGGVVAREVRSYLEENPDVPLSAAQAVRELGMKVLLKHFDRYLYHTIRLMIPGFIASVFFQIERIYFLCHIITLLLFAIAVTGVIYCMKNSRDHRAAVFMIVTVGVIIMMVGIINLIFTGLQRYMVYMMGIFYCNMYLLMKNTVITVAQRFPQNRLLVGVARTLGGQEG